MCIITYRIVESKNAGFKEGDYVVANFGWRTHTISNGENVYKLDRNMFTEQKLSAALGVLGMPGYVHSSYSYLCYTCILIFIIRTMLLLVNYVQSCILYYSGSCNVNS